MSRKSARSNVFRVMAAVVTLALASPLATMATAQSRPSDEDRPQQQRPRVSPDEARRGASTYGRPIDTQPRRDGNYSVLVERGGQVREVVVDGRTGRSQPNTNNDDQRPRRPN